MLSFKYPQIIIKLECQFGIDNNICVDACLNGYSPDAITKICTKVKCSDGCLICNSNGTLCT